MDAPRRSFIKNTRLIRTRTSLGYTYTWHFEDEFGLTVEIYVEEFSHFIRNNLAMLRLSKKSIFNYL
ncbi:MAG: Uncharacterised protein [Cryomorphaceae bacterium]|nr:MAG: Uncharacterised protein [Cryomorphaceae bacterium]